MSGHTHIHTYTQDNYSNPRCACAPRVNENTTHALFASMNAPGYWLTLTTYDYTVLNKLVIILIIHYISNSNKVHLYIELHFCAFAYHIAFAFSYNHIIIIILSLDLHTLKGLMKIFSPRVSNCS